MRERSKRTAGMTPMSRNGKHGTSLDTPLDHSGPREGLTGRRGSPLGSEERLVMFGKAKQAARSSLKELSGVSQRTNELFAMPRRR